MQKQTKKLLLTIWLSCLTYGQATAQTVYVVVNAGTKIDGLSAEDVSGIYLGKKTLWDDGTRIKAFRLNNENPATGTFLTKYIKKTLDEYLGYWRRRLFSGEGVPPAIANSDQAVADAVGTWSGAIGFVSSKADAKNITYVKIEPQLLQAQARWVVKLPDDMVADEFESMKIGQHA